MFGGRKPQPPQGTQPLASSASPQNPTNSAQPPRQPVGFETVIGANTTLHGELHSLANVRIDGTFDGAIDIDGNILVGETARITANIHASNISIAGAVRGDVIGSKIQLMRTGRVWGDLSAATITTEEGAFIEGKITMHGHPAAKGFDQQALLAPEVSVLHPTAEDATSGEPLEVEMMDDHPTPTEGLAHSNNSSPQ